MVLKLVIDDDEDIVTLPIKLEVPDVEQCSTPSIPAVEMPRTNPLTGIQRKKRPRTDLPNTTKLTKMDSRPNFNQTLPITSHQARKFKLPLSKAIDTNLERLNNLQNDRSDIQKNIANLDQKLNAACKQYIAVSEEKTRRFVGKGRS